MEKTSTVWLKKKKKKPLIKRYAGSILIPFLPHLANFYAQYLTVIQSFKEAYLRNNPKYWDTQLRYPNI